MSCSCDGVPCAGCDVHGDHGNARAFLDSLVRSDAITPERMTDELTFVALDKKDHKGTGTKLLANVLGMFSDPHDERDIAVEIGNRRTHRFKAIAADPKWRPQLLSDMYTALNNEEDYGGVMTKDNGLNFVCEIGAYPKDLYEAVLLADVCPGGFWSLITMQGAGAPDSGKHDPPLLDMFMPDNYKDMTNNEREAYNRACDLVKDWFLEKIETGEVDEPEDKVLAALGVSEEEYPGEERGED
jgi:hypothetical protein